MVFNVSAINNKNQVNSEGNNPLSAFINAVSIEGGSKKLFIIKNPRQ
jgi:hypothetical protein